MVTIVFGLATALLWGLPDVPLAVAIRRVGWLAVLAGSVVAGTVLVSPLLLFVDRPEFTARGLALAALTGLLITVGYATAFNAFARCPVSIATPIISCEGAAAAAIAIAFGERPSVGLLVALAAAAVGVVVVSISGRAAEPVSRAGLGFAVAAALIWGAVLALGGPVTDELGAYWGFFLVRAASTIVLAPFLFRTTVRSGMRSEPRRILIWAVGDTGGTLCYFVAADAGPVALAAVLAAQFATLAAIGGVLFLKERLRPHQWAGVAIVIAAVSAVAVLSA